MCKKKHLYIEEKEPKFISLFQMFNIPNICRFFSIVSPFSLKYIYMKSRRSTSPYKTHLEIYLFMNEEIFFIYFHHTANGEIFKVLPTHCFTSYTEQRTTNVFLLLTLTTMAVENGILFL